MTLIGEHQLFELEFFIIHYLRFRFFLILDLIENSCSFICFKISLGEAVFARCLSSLKDERAGASKQLTGPTIKFTGDKQKFVEQISQVFFFLIFSTFSFLYIFLCFCIV